MITVKDLVDFGNGLLKKRGIENSGVSDADVRNFLEMAGLILDAALPLNRRVIIDIPAQGIHADAVVIKEHTDGRTKTYDLKILVSVIGGNEKYARLYNIDSELVKEV